MYAVYAFCREVDDVADEPGSLPAKLEELAAWRDEIAALYAGRPTRPTTTALLDPVRDFDPPRAGVRGAGRRMEMDATEAVQAPDLSTLQLYCRRVAACRGLLRSVSSALTPRARPSSPSQPARPCSSPTSCATSTRTPSAGGLYVPHELLDEAGIAAREPEAVWRTPLPRRLHRPRRDRRRAVRRRRAGSGAATRSARALRPAGVDDEGLRADAAAPGQRGFHRLREPVRVSGKERAWIALRHSLLQR